MLVHVLVSSQPHYVNHVAPIYRALPDEIRGDFHVRSASAAKARTEQLKIPTVRPRLFRPSEIVMVAGYEDYRIARRSRVIFVNHGVGQTYLGRGERMSSYSGGKDREATICFLCPSERDAAINRAYYPEIPAIPVGVPYLDQFSNLNRSSDGPITFSFHANLPFIQETRWAWPWIRDTIREITRSAPKDFLGHSHPKARRHLQPWFRHLGIPYEPDLWEVFRKASVYVIDNSSSGYEAAALGIPTVWLDPPYYRRDVQHGLRFWEAIPGIQVDDPGELEKAIKLAIQNPPELVGKRDKALATAYSGPDGTLLIDGHATERAVEAICRTIGWSSSPPNSSTASLMA